MRTELGALKGNQFVRFSETSIFAKPHNEEAMKALQNIILEGNKDLVWSVNGYVFTFYAPCGTCASFLGDPPTSPNGGKPMYVGSLCVPGGYESPGVLHYPWVAGNKPFTETGPSYSPICSDNPNYEPAKKLKQNADGKEQGWVNFTVKDEPCGEPEDGSGAGEGQIATPPSCPSFKGKFHYVDTHLTQQRPLKLYTAADEASDSGKTIPVDTLVCQIDRPGAWWKVRPVTADKEIDKVWWVESRYLACCKDAPEGAAQ